VAALESAPGVERPLQRPWSEADDAMLGTLPDAELAKKLNRTVASVNSRRRSRRIRPFRDS